MKPSSILAFLTLVAAGSTTNALAPPNQPPTISRRATWGTAAGTVAAVLATMTTPAVAAPAQGADLFEANCAACHAAGDKLGSKEMSLKKEALEANKRGLDVNEIQKYLQNEFPHTYMPLKLTDQDYTKVSTYVLDKALKDTWD